MKNTTFGKPSWVPGKHSSFPVAAGHQRLLPVRQEGAVCCTANLRAGLIESVDSPILKLPIKLENLEMTSAKQRVANRSNSKRSTGPKSFRGKARSRSNALKHGLTAERMLIAGEDAGEFEMFTRGIIEDLEPLGRLEQTLAERVADLLWRLNRASFFEAAVFEARDAATEDKDAVRLMIQLEENRRARLIEMAERYSIGDEKIETSPKKEREIWDAADSAAIQEATENSESGRAAMGRALIADSETSDALGKVLRYETALNNTLARTMSMLLTLQSARLNSEQASAITTSQQR